MFREILHIFGRHHWSNWTEPIPTETKGGFVAALSGSEIHGVQNRYCHICNLYQSNIVESLAEGYDIDTRDLDELVGFADVEEEHADF